MKVSADLFKKPIVDVRAPVEFRDGHLPGSLNLPLLTDSERAEVGTEYKQRGQESAIQLGHRLVSGDTKASRVDQWVHHLQDPQSVIMCFRGGLRSQTVQSWVGERGVSRDLVEGGYKACRNFLLNLITEISPNIKWTVVTGLTGAGKTEFLKSHGDHALDLEGLAKHRGSAFGSAGVEQPSQATFENAIGVELLRLREVVGEVLIEDESRLIGSLVIPEILYQAMQVAPRTEVKAPLADRVERIFQEYILESPLGKGDSGHFDQFEGAVKSLSKRLGGLRTQELLVDLNSARQAFIGHGDLEPNRVWIEKLLIWYYDPVYQRGLKSRS